MFKNTASQKVYVFAFDATTNVPKTGDAAQIAAYVAKDFGAVTQLTDTSATECDATNAPGYYLFDISQTETNADVLMISGKSSTGNVKILGAPAVIFTLPPNFGATSIDSNGRVDVIKIAGTTQTAGDIFARIGAPAGASVSADVAAVKVDTAAVKVQTDKMTFTVANKMDSNVYTWNGTAVSAPATAGIPEVNVKNINNVAAATPGATGGVLIAGSNAATTFASATVTGALTVSDGIVVACSTSNKSAIAATGNGTGHGLIATSGSGATGNGIQATSNATAGSGLAATGKGTGHGIDAESGTGATGDGILAKANSTDGYGLEARGAGGNAGILAKGGATANGFSAVGGDTSGSGADFVAATLGHGVKMRGTGNGDDNAHGLRVSGGGTGANDGLHAVAGTGGVPISGNITANITGNLSGTVGSVTGAVGSVTGNVGGNVVGSVASVTAAVGITSNIKKNQALAKFQFLLTDSTGHAPVTGKTVTCTRSIDNGAFAAGTLANVAELSNGIYTVDFGAGDLNGNVIILRATAAGSDDTFERIICQP